MKYLISIFEKNGAFSANVTRTACKFSTFTTIRFRFIDRSNYVNANASRIYRNFDGDSAALAEIKEYWKYLYELKMPFLGYSGGKLPDEGVPGSFMIFALENRKTAACWLWLKDELMFSDRIAVKLPQKGRYPVGRGAFHD